MERIPEPELMDEAEQALAYARADFEAPNSAFVERYAELIGVTGGRVLDVGCGPGDIPLRLARRFPGLRVDGLDGAEAMLALARDALAREPAIGDRVRFIHDDVAGDSVRGAAYDAVVSNSLLHHLHEPSTLWRLVKETARPGAGVLVMDLYRPDTRERAAEIVATYASDEPEVLRRDFFNSLLAAFTPGEVREQLACAGLPHLRVETVSDRHLLVHGRA
ncbi:class I SAM-dependent methyltransferase [Aquisalimonas asiatica]|uniref:Methyltransferase domain-containing protein n=1 Tax=Aquisalimonas asiatica TaxID=406100 RepID=A0A1H8RNS2_9GAMM|nr:class I SAM-dependent methyltransferase [Aquisalimonas asiatica]SEO67814.1 Methyltransferase domain-containing protein [Aquisalimonas asiatica]